MPTDKSGKFHLSSQRAHAADKMPAPSSTPLSDSAAPSIDESGSVPEHLSAMHAEQGGKHMHVHSDGMSHTTHHVGEDGQVQGPHSHENLAALKAHLDQFFTEEGHEPSESQPSKDMY